MFRRILPPNAGSGQWPLPLPKRFTNTSDSLLAASCFAQFYMFRFAAISHLLYALFPQCLFAAPVLSCTIAAASAVMTSALSALAAKPAQDTAPKPAALAAV